MRYRSYKTALFNILYFLSHRSHFNRFYRWFFIRCSQCYRTCVMGSLLISMVSLRCFLSSFRFHIRSFPRHYIGLSFLITSFYMARFARLNVLGRNFTMTRIAWFTMTCIARFAVTSSILARRVVNQCSSTFGRSSCRCFFGIAATAKLF